MKIEIEKKELEKKVGIVSKAAPSKANMPILTCIVIDAKDGVISMHATDTNLGISTKVDGQILDEGSVAVDAKTFSNFVRKIPDGKKVTIKTTDNGSSEIIITCGKTRLKMGYKDSSAFPYMKKVDGNQFEIKQNDFRCALNGCIYCVSSTENNKLMTGINIKTVGSDMFLTALDGFRIAIQKISLQKKYADEDFNITIPADILKEVSKLLVLKDDLLEFSFDQNSITFTVDDVTVTGRLISGEYFAVENVIPKEFSTDLNVNKNDLMGAVDRSITFKNELNKTAIVLKVESSSLEVSIKSTLGHMKENLEFEQRGKDITIGFNPDYLLDSLRVIDDEDISLHLIDQQSPMVIKGTDYLHMVLPVNIQVA